MDVLLPPVPGVESLLEVGRVVAEGGTMWKDCGGEGGTYWCVSSVHHLTSGHWAACWAATPSVPFLDSAGRWPEERRGRLDRQEGWK